MRLYSRKASKDQFVTYKFSSVFVSLRISLFILYGRPDNTESIEFCDNLIFRLRDVIYIRDWSQYVVKVVKDEVKVISIATRTVAWSLGMRLTSVGSQLSDCARTQNQTRKEPAKIQTHLHSLTNEEINVSTDFLSMTYVHQSNEAAIFQPA